MLEHQIKASAVSSGFVEIRRIPITRVGSQTNIHKYE
jgi:hypothetical protein